jgi:hypothetical protein
MSQSEALTVLRTYRSDIIDGMYCWGVTKDGRSLDRLHVESPMFDDLPSPQEIDSCVLNVTADDGQEVEVVFGSGGIVADKRLSPGVWQYRLQEAHQVLDRAASDLTSGSWWREQLHKASRSLRHRQQYAVPFLAVVLVMVSAWVLRRRIARHGLNRAAPAPASDRPGD